MTRGVFGASWIVPLACFSSAVHAEATPAPKQASLFDTFEFGGHVELVYERLRNFDLDGAEGDSLDLLPVELELGLLFTPTTISRPISSPS